MASGLTNYQNQVIQEIQKTPVEHLPHLLQLIRIFRESVTLKNAEESFRQGWVEAASGETRPVSELWEGIDTE